MKESNGQVNKSEFKINCETNQCYMYLYVSILTANSKWKSVSFFHKQIQSLRECLLKSLGRADMSIGHCFVTIKCPLISPVCCWVLQDGHITMEEYLVWTVNNALCDDFLDLLSQVQQLDHVVIF